MADEAKQEGSAPLPPKLDLRKSGVLRGTEPRPGMPAAPGVAAPAPPAAPRAAGPAVPKPAPPAAAKPVVPAAAQPVAPVKPTSPAVAPAAAKPVAPAAAQPVAPVKPTSPAVAPAAAKPAAPAAAQPVAPVKPTSPAVAPAAAKAVAPAPAAAPKPSGPRPAAAAMKPVLPPGAKPMKAAGAPVAAPGTPAAAAAKKQTAKIPLEAAKPKATTTPIVSVPKPPSDAVAAAKRKTSRISLEAVLGADGEVADGSGPKTIRLKRPGEGGAPKISTQAKTVNAVKPPMADKPDADMSQTQKKTVVVKKAALQTGGKKLSVARADVATGAEVSGAPVSLMPAVAQDEPSWVFGVIAIAASLVISAVVYLFASQAIGPDSSLTKYSSWQGGPDLGWSGKISATR